MEARDGLQISVLATGSTGNVTYIESDKSKLLVDCGLSGKKTESLLADIGRRPENLDGILVTHEHSDHILGVGVMARKYNLPVYANKKTWQAMEDKIGPVDDGLKFIFPNETTMTIGNIDVSSFGVSHDAVDPQFYTFQKDNKRFSILTDTGYVSDRMRGFLKNSDVYLFESNHDIEMLRRGPYPWYLKQRIISDRGHLSNEDGGLALAEIVGDQTKRIYLGHLSQHNNLKEIAKGAVEDILIKKETGLYHQFDLLVGKPDEASPLYKI